MKITQQALCKRYGVTRQGHYQKRRREEDREAEEQAILEKVLEIRQRHPMMGGRKLLYKLFPSMKIGRDRFFALLRRHDQLVKRRRKGRRTTFPGGLRSEDLLSKEDIIWRDQAVVSDITYIETEKGFTYLSLVTDRYSRKIVGWELSDTLEASKALRALKRAVRHAGGSVGGMIHHSDHGNQYTSREYLSYMRQKGIRSSMGRVGNAYDNAVAERVNGILKMEYHLDQRFRDYSCAYQAVREAIYLYNEERPHCSLGMATPAQVYAFSSPCWSDSCRIKARLIR